MEMPVRKECVHGCFRLSRNSPTHEFWVPDPGTASHGLDLYAARNKLFGFGPTYDELSYILRANSRAHRPGQRFHVTIVQLLFDELEMKNVIESWKRRSILRGHILDFVPGP